jgi:hypothetical protein
MGNATGWKKLNDRLFALGSWLYGEDDSRFDLRALFDISSDQYKNMPDGQRMLILKELHYCGVDATFIAGLDLGSPLDQEDMLREKFQLASSDDFSSLDIHYPVNWCRQKPAGYFHDRPHLDKSIWDDSWRAIVGELELITPQLYRRLLDQPDIRVRKRLLYLNQTLEYPACWPFPNDESIMDAVEDKLLERMDAFPPEARDEYGFIRIQAEDIHYELDPVYRDEKAKLARELYEAIEHMDVKALEPHSLLFYGARVVPREDQGPLTKEWLYRRLWDPALRRDVAKLGSVKLYLKPLRDIRLNRKAWIEILGAK